MNNKKQYYKLDDIGFVGTQEKSTTTKKEEKAISDFFKAEKIKNEKKHHLKVAKNGVMMPKMALLQDLQNQHKI